MLNELATEKVSWIKEESDNECLNLKPWVLILAKNWVRDCEVDRACKHGVRKGRILINLSPTSRMLWCQTEWTEGAKMVRK